MSHSSYIMTKQTKESAMDEYLASIGLWRKQIARDGSCIFRAVSERLYMTQALHLRVRDACRHHLQCHQDIFQEMVEGDFDLHMFNLRHPKEPASEVDIKVLADLYKHDFLVYNEPGQPPVNVTQNNNTDTFQLCQTEGTHYDLVYKKSQHDSAATCQSILYEMLYKNVFGVPKPVEKGAEMMTYKSKIRKDSISSLADKSESSTTDIGELESSPDYKGERKSLPFPYRVAKALDPTIYRNVEYDIWVDSRKEEDDIPEQEFLPGDKCQVVLNPVSQKVFNAHIQEIGSDKTSVTVFIEELGEKHTIHYRSLRPVHQTHYQELTAAGRKKHKKRKEMPVVLPFGRGGGAPPNLQADFHTSKRLHFNPHCSGGRGRFAWSHHQGTLHNGAINTEMMSQEKKGGAVETDLTTGLGVSVDSKTKDAVLDMADFPALTSHKHLPNQETQKDVKDGPHKEQPDIYHDGSVPVDIGAAAVGAGQHLSMVLPPGGHAMTAQGAPVSSEAPFLYPPPLHQPPPAHAGHVPFYPFLVLPQSDGSGPININVQPSTDPAGADLPHNDPSTLRFFFNLGLEYYRVMALMQAQQQRYPPYITNHQMAYQPTTPVAVPPGEALYLSAEEEANVNGQSSVKVSTRKQKVVEQKEGQENITVVKEQCHEEEEDKDKIYSSQTEKKTNSLSSACDFPCYDSEVGLDSGCASDVSSGAEGCPTTEDCCDNAFVADHHSDNGDSPINTTSDSHSDSSSQHSTSNGSSDSGLQMIKQYRVPPRTRYNSQGQIKLMKPLKDIPPRFQKMLSCNPAIKHEQFEGQPIMRQSRMVKPKSVTVSASTISESPPQHNFNPNAESFVPRQQSSSGSGSTPVSSIASMAATFSSCQTSGEYCPGAGRDAYCGHVGPPYGTSVSGGSSSTTTQSGQALHAPTYTIHIFNSASASCNVDGSSAACPVSNVAPSVPPTGCYGPGLPANAISYPTNPSSSGGATSGGIVYYCQQGGYPSPQNFSSGANYTQPPSIPNPSNQQIIYTSNPQIAYSPYHAQQGQYQYT